MCPLPTGRALAKLRARSEARALQAAERMERLGDKLMGLCEAVINGPSSGPPDETAPIRFIIQGLACGRRFVSDLDRRRTRVAQSSRDTPTSNAGRQSGAVSSPGRAVLRAVCHAAPSAGWSCSSARSGFVAEPDFYSGRSKPSSRAIAIPGWHGRSARLLDRFVAALLAMTP